MLDILAASFPQGLTIMPLRNLHPGILSFLLLAHAAQAQFNSAPAEGVPTPTASGGFIRDSRQHPAEPSRNHAFSMTINRYGIAATLQTLGSQASATILSKGGNAVDAAIAANAAVGVIEPMMNGIGGDLFAIVWDPKEKKMYALNASGWSAKAETIEAMKARGLTTMDDTQHLCCHRSRSRCRLGGPARKVRQTATRCRPCPCHRSG